MHIVCQLDFELYVLLAYAISLSTILEEISIFLTFCTDENLTMSKHQLDSSFFS